MKARNATWLGLMLSAWRTQGEGGARSAIVAQPGSRRAVVRRTEARQASLSLELVCNPIWLCVQLDLDTPK